MTERLTPPATFYRRLRAWSLAGAVPVLALAGLAWWIAPEAAAHAWLAAFVLWTGLALGCLGLLMAGHLLGEEWLGPLRGELEAGVLTLPLLGLASVPVLLGLDMLYPWAEPGRGNAWLSPLPFAARTILCFVAWSALAWILTRPGGHHRAASALGLVLLLPSVSIASTDWVLSLHPEWMSNSYGLAFGAGHLAAAFAAAILTATARPDREPPGRVSGLAGFLLVLLAATAYLWFTQFLTVWSANLPAEAAWYLERGGAWLWLVPGIALPATALAALMLLTRRARGLRPVLIGASLMVLVQHVANHYWQIRPSVPGLGLHWADPLAAAALGLACLAVFALALPGRPVRAEQPGEAEPTLLDPG